MKHLTLIAAIITFTSCTSPSKITASWKSPTEVNRNYKVIFVAAMTKSNIVRSTFETDMAAELNKNNVRTLKSIDEFPPQFSKDSIPKDALMSAVKKDGSEAILTITILKKSTESRYVNGGYYPYRYGYYGNFWGYYNYWYPYAYDDSYYVTTDVYYIETNLYDSKTELLLWSAQTRSYTYDGINNFSKELATVVVDKLRSDKIISSSPSKDKDDVYSSR